MMNIDDNNLDDLFRRRLEGYSPEPPPGAWEKIGQGLGRGKVRLMWIRRVAAAAVLLVAVTTSLVLWDAGDRNLPDKVAIDRAGEAASPSVGTQGSDLAAVIPGKEAATAVLPKDVTSSLTRTSGDQPALTRVSQGVVASASAGDGSVTGAAGSSERETLPRLSLEYLKRVTGLAEVSRVKNALLSLDFPNRMKTTGLLAALAPDQTAGKTSGVKEKEDGWKVGFQIAPGYSSYHADYQKMYAANMSRSVEQSQAAIGGGISVHYKTSRRLRVESGLYYSRTGDKQESGGKELFSFADYAGPARESGSLKLYSNAVQLNNGQIGLNSTAGVIKLNAASANAEFIALPERFGEMDNSFQMMTYGGFSQVFDFMEVPLNLRYRLIDRQLALELFSGVSTNFMVGNSVFLDNASDSRKVGSTANAADVSFSGLAGITLIYPLGRHFSLSMEPRATYWLSSINKSSAVEFRPWRIGVQTGLFYEF